jgi:hypothetical protein
MMFGVDGARSWGAFFGQAAAGFMRKPGGQRKTMPADAYGEAPNGRQRR